MTKEVEIKELTAEDLLRLATEGEIAEGEGAHKEKLGGFILRLREWERPGPSFEDWAKIEVLEGEIRKLPIRCRKI